MTNVYLGIAALLLYVVAATIIVRALCVCRMRDAYRALAMTFGGLSIMMLSIACGCFAAIV